MRTQRRTCLRCTREFLVNLQDDYGEDWGQELKDEIEQAKAVDFQVVSLPGRLAFLCPDHHDPHAPTR